MTQEEMQQAILDLQESQKTITEENKTLKTQLEEKTKREKELEEHNQKLFLRITSNVTTEDEKKKEDQEELKDYVGEKVFNLLNDKDLKKLKEITKGDDE